LDEFSPDYWRCPACETLVLKHLPQGDVTRVGDDEADLYSKRYYLEHLQGAYGYPDLLQRTRADLPERCLHWLRTVLKYKTPSGKALELGSAHGGFVALLRWAGFDATGLELSPWLVDYARRTFDVPMLTGPLEDQSLPAGSLDVIALMDVLEHLPDPVGTMRRCLDLLKPDGILVIQTPRYPEAMTFAEMQARQDPFLFQLKPQEHLFLFSQTALQEMFRRLGAGSVTFEPAIFAQYDMFPVVSRQPAAVQATEATEAALMASPTGRLVLALIDADAAQQPIRRRLGGVEEERNLLQHQLADLRRHFEASEVDRAARLAVIEDQGRRQGEVESERNDLRHQLQDLRRQFQGLEADYAARLEVIHAQGRQLGEVEAERNDLRYQSEDIRQQFRAMEVDYAARLEVINDQGNRLSASEAERQALLGHLSELTARVSAQDLMAAAYQQQVRLLTDQTRRLQTALHAIRQSRIYRLSRQFGLWHVAEQTIEGVTWNE
jgi:SAM-dependent methyltransferase